MKDISFITSVKNGNKFINDLPHFDSFLWEKFDKLNGNSTKIVSEIAERIRLLKIKKSECYIISEDSDLDTTTWDMVTLFNTDNLSIGFATILVFGDADFIYLHDETHYQYISKI